jgi:platelet-activating factor acetylhydrolase
MATLPREGARDKEKEEYPLPKPTGPHSVGFIDVEWDEDEQSATKTNILVRIFYPSNVSREYFEREPILRATWIPGPQYYPSYGYVLRVPLFFISPLVRFCFGNIRIWAIEEAPILDMSERKQLPILIFSHGLGGIRTTYSSLCTDLASHGFVVCALEHRDGSASMTLLKGNRQKYQFSPRLDSLNIDRPAEMEMMAQALNMSSDPYDLNEQPLFRHRQLRQRCHEIDILRRLLDRVHQGHMCRNLWIQDSPPDNTLASSDEGSSVWFLQDRLCLDNITLMGHSFGGITAMHYALTRTESFECRAVIALDPWMYAVDPSFLLESQERKRIKLLVVTMEQFHWTENLAPTRSFVKANAMEPIAYTIRRGNHMQCADIPLLCGRFLRHFCVKPNSPPSLQVVQCLRRMVLEFAATSRIDIDAYEKLFGDLLMSFRV